MEKHDTALLLRDRSDRRINAIAGGVTYTLTDSSDFDDVNGNMREGLKLGSRDRFICMSETRRVPLL